MSRWVLCVQNSFAPVTQLLHLQRLGHVKTAPAPARLSNVYSEHVDAELVAAQAAMNYVVVQVSIHIVMPWHALASLSCPGMPWHALACIVILVMTRCALLSLGMPCHLDLRLLYPVTPCHVLS